MNQVPVRQRLDLMRWRRVGLEERPGWLGGLQLAPIVKIDCKVDGKSLGKLCSITGLVGDQAFVLEIWIAQKPQQGGSTARPGKLPNIQNQVRVIARWSSQGLGDGGPDCAAVTGSPCS